MFLFFGGTQMKMVIAEMGPGWNNIWINTYSIRFLFGERERSVAEELRR